MNVGIIGAGRIATKMANTLNQTMGFTNYAIASRNLEKAETFKKENGCLKAYGCYEELLKDKHVDFVYIATPHAFHYEQMMQCIHYHKPVLCEKAFCMNYQQAYDVLNDAKEKKVLIAEALWTSYMPSKKRIRDLLFQEKAIGKLTKVQAVFKTNVIYKERVIRKDLGGGALLDLGVYPISMILRILGNQFLSFEIKNIQYHESGVDIKETITFTYPTLLATCIVDVTSNYESYIEFVGEKGTIVVKDIQCPSTITLFDSHNNKIKQIDCTPQLGGFEYELYAMKEAIEKDWLETPEWSHQEILQLMKILDTILYGKHEK